MRLAKKSDVKNVVHILSKAFISNPSVNWVIKNDRKKEKRIKALCEYSFKTALLRNGAFISDDEKGVALCFQYNIKKESLIDYWNQLILVIKAIGLSRVFGVLKREAYAKSKRPKDGNYLYFWFLGVDPLFQNGNGARDLKNFVLKMADERQLPIFLETSVEKNRRAYQRFGFQVYHTWEVKEKNIDLYFMRRDPLKRNE